MPYYFLMRSPGGDYQLCDTDMPQQKNGLKENRFIKGSKIKSEEIMEPIIINLRYIEDVMPEFFMFPLVFRDDLLADILEFGIENIDSYKCTLLDNISGKIWTEYKVCNIIGMLDVFDMNASKLFVDSPRDDAYLFDEIVINESKALNQHIFRPYGRPSDILISEELKNYLETKSKYINMQFVKPKNFA
ncbi:MAG: hypothetical protein JW982_16800 [Spirochaetes bacterium]|nr:hypothetical protein [Spirochaetota bacterium]